MKKVLVELLADDAAVLRVMINQPCEPRDEFDPEALSFDSVCERVTNALNQALPVTDGPSAIGFLREVFEVMDRNMGPEINFEGYPVDKEPPSQEGVCGCGRGGEKRLRFPYNVGPLDRPADNPTLDFPNRRVGSWCYGGMPSPGPKVCTDAEGGMDSDRRDEGLAKDGNEFLDPAAAGIVDKNREKWKDQPDYFGLALNEWQREFVFNCGKKEANARFLAGWPGHGKSTALCALAVRLACEGTRVLFVSKSESTLGYHYSKIRDASEGSGLIYDKLSRTFVCGAGSIRLAVGESVGNARGETYGAALVDDADCLGVKELVELWIQINYLVREEPWIRVLAVEDISGLLGAGIELHIPTEMKEIYFLHQPVVELRDSARLFDARKLLAELRSAKGVPPVLGEAEEAKVNLFIPITDEAVPDEADELEARFVAECPGAIITPAVEIEKKSLKGEEFHYPRNETPAGGLVDYTEPGIVVGMDLRGPFSTGYEVGGSALVVDEGDGSATLPVPDGHRPLLEREVTGAGQTAVTAFGMPVVKSEDVPANAVVLLGPDDDRTDRTDRADKTSEGAGRSTKRGAEISINPEKDAPPFSEVKPEVSSAAPSLYILPLASIFGAMKVIHLRNSKAEMAARLKKPEWLIQALKAFFVELGVPIHPKVAEPWAEWLQKAKAALDEKHPRAVRIDVREDGCAVSCAPEPLAPMPPSTVHKIRKGSEG